MPPKGSRRRREIPVSRKLDIVKRFKDGESYHKLERETGFQRKQIRNWVKDERQLLSLSEKQKRKRLSGSGSKPKFGDIEIHLYTWFKDERESKHQVDYIRLREKAQEIAKELCTADFVASNKWIFNFCRRHNISSRRITHRGQQDGRTFAEKSQIVKEFLTSSAMLTAGFQLTHIYNMDETPCYFDMASDQTMHFKGDKNVDGIDTGHRKSRFTVVLCSCADGRMVKTLIIFKGLKNVPKLNLPTDIEVTVSMGGSMNTGLMLKWIRTCFAQRGPFLANTPSILFMDSFGSHMKEEISNSLRTRCSTKVQIIPPKMTCVLQPLDVSVNSPFKTALRQSWNDWLVNGEKETTSKGYRRRPSYQVLVDMVSVAVRSLHKEVIMKSFRVCGIAADGNQVPTDELNGRLQQMLESQNAMVEIDREGQMEAGDDVEFSMSAESCSSDESEDSD